ncbi:E3 SUMO-protein ligase pli1 [Elasticomyces elasticus]|nr:E3 SUMO-protein ligase pli1 [Elasticomyces elasticus]
MASGARVLQQDGDTLKRRIKLLINSDLKTICRAEGLAVSGVKAALQSRICDHLDTIVNQGDVRHFERVRYRVAQHGESPPPEDFASSPPTTSAAGTAAPMNSKMAAAVWQRPQNPQHGASRPMIGIPMRVTFKRSPFYEIREPLTPVYDLPPMTQNRNTVPASLVLTQTVCDRLKSDPTLRLMIYCTPELGISAALADIAFPNNIEIKVNQEDVKANFKGLKNKPGTTKPADITDLVRKAPGYSNNITFTYALTQKASPKYSFVVNLVGKHSADRLAEQVKRGKVLSKDSVIQEMRNKANDMDIVATSTVMSLKDPISTLRMTLPCRSSHCPHNQCFDGICFLQLQEQAPTWTCPICSRYVSFEVLCVDQYVQDILQRTPESIEKVTVEPNGDWTPVRPEEDPSTNGNRQPQPKASYDDDDSDDDIVEVKNYHPRGLKPEAKQSASAAFNQNTPPLSSREPSTAGSASRPSTNSNKRPANAVIDLTLSDDEDEQPPRPAKRHSTLHSQGTSSSNQNASASYTTPPSVTFPEPRPGANLPYRASSLSGQQQQQGQRAGMMAPFRLGPIAQTPQSVQNRSVPLALPPLPPPIPPPAPKYNDSNGMGSYQGYSDFSNSPG